MKTMVSAIKKIGSSEYDVVEMNVECTKVVRTICTCDGYESAQVIIDMINKGEISWQ